MRRAMVGAQILAVIVSSGCFTIQRRVEFTDTERMKVTFESAAAAKAFNKAFDSPAVRHSDWKFTVSPLLLMSVEFVLYETEWYNHLVRLADINRDSVITEEETRLLPLPPVQEKK